MVANALMHNILKGQDTFFFLMKGSIYGVYSIFDVGED